MVEVEKFENMDKQKKEKRNNVYSSTIQRSYAFQTSLNGWI